MIIGYGENWINKYKKEWKILLEENNAPFVRKYRNVDNHQKLHTIYVVHVNAP